MNDPPAEGRRFLPGISAVVLLVLLPFLPLGLAFAEHEMLGSNRVENFCRQVGVHGVLDKLYKETVFKIF